MSNFDMLRKTENHYLRFHGKLQDNLTFVPRIGWETNHLSPGPKIETDDKSPYRVQLLNKDDKVILERIPSVEFDSVCEMSSQHALKGNVIAYLPINPYAKKIRFRHLDHTIYEDSIAQDPPSVKIVSASLQNNVLNLRWTAISKADKPLRFNIAYIVDKQHTYKLALDLNASNARFNVKELPGGKRINVAVIVSDGIRSSYAVSNILSKPPLPVKTHILKPGENEIFHADQMITLSGQCNDQHTNKMNEEKMVWKIDDKVVQTGKSIGYITGLSSGIHNVTLEIRSGRRLLDSQNHKIRILKPSVQQQRQKDFLDRVALRKKQLR